MFVMTVLLDLEDLRKRGIKFTRQHLHRLVRNEKFPAPVKVGENTNAWVETEIDAYIKARIAKRDSQRRTQSAA
jgi:prophage regulatory protein